MVESCKQFGQIQVPSEFSSKRNFMTAIGLKVPEVSSHSLSMQQLNKDFYLIDFN